MSIFLNKDNKVIVQGITGGEGTKHTALMLKAGTNIVGGVNARKAGTTVSHDGGVELHRVRRGCVFGCSTLSCGWFDGGSRSGGR